MFMLSGVDALRFRGNNVEEYGIFDGVNNSLTSFSACVWISTTDNHRQHILSYAYKLNGRDFDNGLLIMLHNDLWIRFDPLGAAMKTFRYNSFFK